MKRRTSAWIIGCRLALAVAGAVGLSPDSARAEEYALPDNWLQWRLEELAGYGQCKRDDPALVLEMQHNMQKMVQAFARVAPRLPPRAYAEPHAQALQMAGCRNVPLGGDASALIWDEHQVDLPPGGRGHGKRRRDAMDVQSSIGLGINKVPALTSVDFSPGGPTNDPDTFVRYHPTSFLQGYPVFDYVDVVVTPPGHAPLFLPVTLEQALTRAIAVHQRTYADVLQSAREDEARVSDSSDLIRSLKSGGESPQKIKEFRDSMLATVRERVDRERDIVDLLKRRWAALTPATRNAQAHVKLYNDQLIPQAESGEDADPLVHFNPAYFDPKLRRSDPQLMIVHLFRALDDLNRPPDDPTDWWVRTARDIDWRAFARENLR